MRQDKLQDMIKGWFVGDFEPSVIQSKECEVAIKHYAAGARESVHYHAVATEITAVVSGRIIMLGREWGSGDIITIEPKEATDFLALTDAITVVVKMPSTSGDKYLIDKEEF